MALRWMDSFDHETFNYFASIPTKKWTGGGNAANGVPRFGSGGLQLFNGGHVYKTLDNQSTWILGFAFRLTYDPANTALLCSVYDDGTTQVDVRVTAAAKIQITRNGTQLAIGATTILQNVWYYGEFKVFIDNTTGTVEFRLNAVTECSATNVDTQNTANNTGNRVYAGPNIPNAELNIDDFYACDGTGSAPTNDFLGDCRVEALFPNGNGNTSQLDGSDGNQVNNYLLVDETNPNEDTDYVESADVGDKDTYTYTNLTPTSGTVFGVQVVPRARKTNAGTRTAVSIARLSGTEVDSSVKTVLDSYIYLPDIRETKPGGGAWTISDVNSAEFGIKVNS